MLVPVHPDQYAAFRLEPLMRFPLIAAVLEGRQSGQVYAAKGARPKENIFVTHKSGFCCLRTVSAAPDYEALLSFIAAQPELPQYLHLYDAAPALMTHVGHREDQFGWKVRKRIQLQFGHPDIDPSAARPRIAVTAHPISADNIARLASLGLQLEQKFWDSAEHFLREGYGVFLADEHAVPVAICYAAGVGAGVAEADVLTLESFKQQGLAKYAAALFVQQGLAKGIRANWDCFEENAGSLKTACSLHFAPTLEYQFLSLFFKNKHTL